ncbi:UPF0481 protein At3g47200 isoform X2 [Elaeis guineensis]|uniref:UPF0481 protein At3g47200 isoform X2 n=1 Tax=Elaeis guineensis var. tenera TaxID=51953 RepID=A0A8N4F9C5_ELAGV|nr:UPF0481 protein At3g47200 isoform X2 [Elaeis guineensis]XP_029121762.1 UPF0481 protein At3g47200 isoform X2 [Elaeis guineensis]
MVAVFNKELLNWYLITLKLKETVDANCARSQPTTPGGRAPPLPITLGDTAPPPQNLNPPPPQDSPWVISIRDKLNQARQLECLSPWAKLSIYRVPKSLREGDEKAYIPHLVSIGPYHRDRRRLRDMEHHKWRALHHVLKRTGHDVHLYLHAVKSLEERARSCYEGHIHLSSNDFVESLVLDGIFMLELFRGAVGEGFRTLGYSHCDPVFAIRGTMHSIQRDMIMLENQIPLFVLDRLLALQLRLPEQTSGLVARLAIQFLDPLMPNDHQLNKTDAAAFDPLAEGGLHCLDVFRRNLLRTGPRPVPRVWLRRWSHRGRVCDRRRQQLVHCVTELRDAGIKFRKRKTDRFWDIEFTNGVLKIPRLLIHDGTKSLFLNLIAFEQCHMDCSNDITSYVIFMDNLINSEEDVRYLHYRGIIEHWLGNDDEVADLFNKLCQEVVFDINDSYLSRLSQQLNRPSS